MPREVALESLARGQSVPRPAFGGANADAPAAALLAGLAARERRSLRCRCYASFSVASLWAPPLARARVKRYHGGADPSGLPGLPRFSSILFSKAWHACADPHVCGPEWRSPSVRVALALATPGLTDGQGREARGARLAPMKPKGDQSCRPSQLRPSSRAGPRFSFRSTSSRSRRRMRGVH
jgi:hypothetical protein